MSDPSIKRRLTRAKEKAMKDLSRIGYKIVPSDNSTFCICGVRKNELRMIRVVVDEITNEDVKLIEGIQTPEVCSREIWCKLEGIRDFVIKEV